MVEIDFNVSFAGEADLNWIVQNDTHIPKHTVERKLEAGEYLI